MNDIEENVNIIKEKMLTASERFAQNYGVKPQLVKLIGVTKTIETAKISKLLELGVTDIGENKAQELLAKHQELGENANWHMIGRLQTNKVKHIIDKVCLIHSVDSLKLGIEINKRAANIGKIMDILIEVNIGLENTKGGIEPKKVEELAFSLMQFENLRVCGLMTVAPNVENQEENRLFFKKIFQLFVDIRDKLDNNRNMKFLSAGMTNDFQVAIEEGANMIRVGTGIFGNRLIK